MPKCNWKKQRILQYVPKLICLFSWELLNLLLVSVDEFHWMVSLNSASLLSPLPLLSSKGSIWLGVVDWNTCSSTDVGVLLDELRFLRHSVKTFFMCFKLEDFDKTGATGSSWAWDLIIERYYTWNILGNWCTYTIEPFGYGISLFWNAETYLLFISDKTLNRNTFVPQMSKVLMLCHERSYGLMYTIM